MQKINLLLISALVYVATTNDSIIFSQAWAEESTYGPTKSGDLIGNIAGKVIPNSSVSRQQMVLGLLKANPQAFKVPCNFNSLKVGEQLQIPPLSDIQAISQADAKKEYNRQNVEWKNRSKQPIVCPTATTQSPPVTPKAEVTPPASPASEEKPATTPTTPPATEEKPAATSTTPPVSPPAANQEKPTTLPVPAVAPNQTAPKTEVKLVPEEKSQGAEKPAEPKPVTTATTSSPSGSEPTSTETTSQPSSALTLGILTIGGLLAALLIGWLLHKPGKQSAKLEGSSSEEDSKFSSSEEPQMIPDNMPLHTPKIKDDEKFKI